MESGIPSLLAQSRLARLYVYDWPPEALRVRGSSSKNALPESRHRQFDGESARAVARIRDRVHFHDFKRPHESTAFIQGSQRSENYSSLLRRKAASPVCSVGGLGRTPR